MEKTVTLGSKKSCNRAFRGSKDGQKRPLGYTFSKIVTEENGLDTTKNGDFWGKLLGYKKYCITQIVLDFLIYNSYKSFFVTEDFWSYAGR